MNAVDKTMNLLITVYIQILFVLATFDWIFVNLLTANYGKMTKESD